MDKPGAGLAERFRRALVSEEEARREAAAAKQRADEEARAAAMQLIGDLVAFGEALSVVGVARTADGADLSHAGRVLRFVRVDGSVEARFGEQKALLYREAQLGGRWVTVLPRRGREQRIPLFDQGLEELLVVGLGLPRPG